MLDLAPIKARLENARMSESVAVTDIRALVEEVERLQQARREIYDLAFMDIQTGSTSRNVARIADLARKIGL